MKKLYPTFAESSSYRGLGQNNSRMSNNEIEKMRKTVLERDNYVCAYCNYKDVENKDISYVDGDSSNNSPDNLATTCSMCTLIVNVRRGYQIEGVVELYSRSSVDQKTIVQKTRQLRSEGMEDNTIIRTLGLRDKALFKLNRNYLKNLYAFVTSSRGNF